MNKEQINIFSISDIHLGHNINPTINIVNNLNSFFIKYDKYIKRCDIISIVGDIFDTLLVAGSKNYNLAIQWITTVAMYCKKNNIKLRILEGTPGHDWRQASTIATVLDKLSLDIDFKYIDTLVIEHMSDLDIDILYIPDEYRHTAIETLDEVKKLLQQHNLTEVDIAFMHGQFDYQIPMVKLDSSHDISEYEAIVKEFISIGHIHKHSVNGKVVAQGSFDRLAHGEEEDKGAVILTINKYSDNSYLFLVNDKAMIFKTIDISNIDVDSVYNYIDNKINGIPIGSAIRLLVSKDSGLMKNKKELITKYNNYKVTIDNKDKDDLQEYKQSVKPLEFNTLDSFNINKDNIVELLMNEVIKNHNLTKDEIELANDELKLAIS